jgi:hypothetical protein
LTLRKTVIEKVKKIKRENANRTLKRENGRGETSMTRLIPGRPTSSNE